MADGRGEGIKHMRNRQLHSSVEMPRHGPVSTYRCCRMQIRNQGLSYDIGVDKCVIDFGYRLSEGSRESCDVAGLIELRSERKKPENLALKVSVAERSMGVPKEYLQLLEGVVLEDTRPTYKATG